MSPSPRLRLAAASVTGGLLLTVGTASAAPDLPAVTDSIEYSGYVVDSVDAFFRLPPADAVAGSAVAGSLALCLLLPGPDNTCVI